MRLYFILLLVLLTIVLLPAAAFAQDAGEDAAAPAPVAGQVVLPWFVMTARPALGFGRGAMDWHWDAFGGLAEHDETVDVVSTGQFAIIPEAFFMPTKARRFIISASLPIAFGSGTFEENDDPDRVLDGEKFNYTHFGLALGLGYQWYFGDTQQTNLFLMGHLGGGRYRFQVLDWEGDDYTSDPLRSWMLDVSVGSTYRFDNGFVLGGSLDFYTLSFAGQAGDDDFLDVDVSGGLTMVRLNFLLGYAFF